MKTEKVFNAQTRRIERVDTWETADEDGVINHHKAVTPESYRGQRYVRVFINKYAEIIMQLDKMSVQAFTFLLKNMDSGTNIARVGYKELKQSLNVSEVTISKAMISLQEVDVVRMYCRREWMVNPEVATACYSSKFNSLIQQYQSLEKRTNKEGSNEDATGQDIQKNTTNTGDECGAVYSQSYKPRDKNIFGLVHEDTERDQGLSPDNSQYDEETGRT